MRIQHNIMAMSAYRNYTNNVSAMKKNLEKLSSGYKINRAGDDAAGLAISEKMRAQITGLETAQKNAKDGISLVQTAEGAMTEVHDMLNRMVELATQSANGTYDNTTDRAQLQKEMDQLRSEINRIADSSNFNGIKLLDGSMSSKGVAGRASQFDLPEVGKLLGSNTVLHEEITGGNTGTQFSVDLHNRQIRNASGATFTMTVGDDIEIKLTGTANGTAAKVVNASDIVKAITASSTSALASMGFTMTVNGSATGFSFGSTGLTIDAVGKDGKIGEVTVSAGNGGDNRLTFTQVNRPTDPDGVWKPANQVGMVYTAPPTGSTHALSLDDDFLIDSEVLSSNPITYSTPVMTLASGPIQIAAASGSLTAKGTTAAAAATKAFGVDGLSLTAGNLTVTGSKALTAAGASKGAVSVQIVGTGSNAKYGLFVGTKQIATAAIASIASGVTATIAFGTIGSIKLTAGTGGVTAAAIQAGTGTVTTNMKIEEANAAITATVGGSGSVFLDALMTGSGAFNLGTGSTAVNITLQYTAPASGASGAGVWTITAGSKGSMNVTAALGSDGRTLKLSKGSSVILTVAADANASIGKFQTAFTTAKQIASYGIQDSGNGKPTIATNATIGEVKTALDGAVGSNAYFKSVATTSGNVVTLSASVGNAITAIGSLASISATIASSVVTALKGAQITVGGITATIATSAISSTTTGSEALQAIVNALNTAAAAKAKTDLAGIGSTGGSITIYYNFRFENAAGSIVAQNAADALTLKYDSKTYRTEEQKPVPGPDGTPIRPWDNNVSTTAIKRVDADSGDRLASTWFTLDNEKVKDGAKVQIGNDTYEFSTDKAYADGNTAGKVYIGDLVDDKGTIKSSDDLSKALERLTWSAKDNEVYTVGYDKDRITVTENQDWNNQGKDTFDLTTKEGVAKSLGYTSPDVKGNGGLKLQIGDTADSYNQLVVDIGDIHTNSLGIADISIATQEDAATAIEAIKSAINQVSDIRGTLGATQNRLDHTINNLSVMTENIQDAESTIRDTDVADEMMAYTKNNILIQSAQAMLAQANQVPQGVLQLLQ